MKCLSLFYEKEVEMKAINNIWFAVKEVAAVSKSMIVKLVVHCVFEILVACMNVFLLKFVTDYAMSGHFDLMKLSTYLFFYCVFMIVNYIYKNNVMGVYTRKFDAGMMSSVMCGIYQKSVRINLADYDKKDFYDKLDRVMDKGGTLYWDILCDCFTLVSRTIALFCVFTVYHDACLMIAVAVNVVSHLILDIQLDKTNYTFEKREETYNRFEDYINRVFSENSYAQELRTSVGVKDILLGKYVRWTEGYLDRYDSYLKYYFHNTAVRNVSAYLVYLVTSVYVSNLLLHQKITVGDFLVMISVVAGMTQQLLDALKTFPQLYQSSKYVGEVRELLAYPTMLDQDAEKESVAGFESMEFRDVCFRYREQDSFRVHDVSFQVHKAEIVAIVGLNGSGKSTLADCMMGLLMPDSGAIRLNGRDYREYKMCDIRKLFSTVFQDFQIYELSVAENILMRKPLSQEDVRLVNEALEYVGLYEKVSTLPQGVHTVLSLSEREGGLSGGEQQLLAIARAYAGQTPVILFDEPTSALDVYMTNRFYQKLFDLREVQKRTVILISHKLKYLDRADNILFVREGAVSGIGSHEELMRRNRQYAALYQLRGEELLEGQP